MLKTKGWLVVGGICINFTFENDQIQYVIKIEKLFYSLRKIIQKADYFF